MAETGTYVYAFSREPVTVEEVGVSDTGVRALAVGELVAYVSTVPLDVYGEEPLKRNLERLDWLEETARAHDRVVRGVARRTTTAPVRLATIYRSDRQLGNALADARETVLAMLDHLVGRSEWGVKAFASASGEATEPANSAEQSGTAYLKRSRQRLYEREDTIRRLSELGADLHVQLAEVAVAARRHPAQHPQLSGRTDPMVLNGAYLVADDRQEEFRERVVALEGKGAELELTGPWAPYSFAEIHLGTPTETSAP